MNVDANSLARCEFGAVDSIARLVGGLRYVRNVVTKSRGSYLEKEPGELFVNFERPCDGAPESFMDGYPGKVLVGRLLSPKLNPAMFGSIKVIPWKPCGAALVLATNRDYIGSTWLAFVPLESIKDLQVEGGS